MPRFFGMHFKLSNFFWFKKQQLKTSDDAYLKPILQHRVLAYASKDESNLETFEVNTMRFLKIIRFKREYKSKEEAIQILKIY